MRPRILVNLIFFAILGVVMAIWAVTSIVKIDALRQPFRVQAEFVSSPGLFKDGEVDYLGVRVGKIGEVRLATGKVVVGLDIDRGVRLPRNLTAEVRRKSAIGEPYIELSPPAKEAASGVLAAGDLIPLERTTVPLDYQRLFQGISKVLSAVEPEDVRTVVHELSVGLEGREQSVRDIIGDAHDLTDTLAREAPLLDELSVELTGFADVLARNRVDIGQILDNNAVFTGAVKDSRRDLSSFLDNSPSLLAKVNNLLDRSRPGLSCVLAAAGTKTTSVFTPATQRNLNRALRSIPTLQGLVRDITEELPDGPYARSAFIFSVPGGPMAAPERPAPRAAPAVPKIGECRTGGAERRPVLRGGDPGSGPARAVAARGGVPRPVDDAAPRAVSETERPVAPRPQQVTSSPVPQAPPAAAPAAPPASGESQITRLLPLLPPLLGLVVLLWVLVAVVGVRPRRRRAARPTAPPTD
ncbi:MCE family protein [Bailinhaonella thermotolerans]|uniref:MCE family protein n=1 Tax=Bailinhaonella thermotolerans TaxID=1070861 RepID=A0A3A4B0D5_9ACTN|nr:MCE family protein [Bailinhaonella thermotolerans]RJL34309.1 MCE family protein [Bailinhaonella thermotolerans]